MQERRDSPKTEPFAFRMSRERLEECRGMCPEARLRWLEEANRFVLRFLGIERLERWKARQK